MAQHALLSVALTLTVLAAKSAHTRWPILRLASKRRPFTPKRKVNPVADSRAVTMDRVVSMRTIEQHGGDVACASPIAPSRTSRLTIQTARAGGYLPRRHALLWRAIRGVT